jgi:hypothetical protein
VEAPSTHFQGRVKGDNGPGPGLPPPWQMLYSILENKAIFWRFQRL